MNRHYQKSQLLTRQQLSDIHALAELIKQQDGILPKWYPSISANPHAYDSNFLYYEDDKLIGFLSFYLFEDDEAEITGFVDPECRGKHVFSGLLDSAIKVLDQLSIHKICFVIPSQNIPAISYAKKVGANVREIEYTLQRKKSESERLSLNEGTLIKVKSADAEVLAEIDAECFASSFPEMFNRFKTTLSEKNRQCYFYAVQNQNIGKLHIKLNDEFALLHDLCILPDFQKQGHGAAMIKLAINQLLAAGVSDIRLEVFLHNKDALALYKGCGFELMRVDESWQVSV